MLISILITVPIVAAYVALLVTTMRHAFAQTRRGASGGDTD
jgi:hypothetical protein